ncbi:zinc-binding alcohol dehydrogenase domain-containing protein cipB [Apiospora phragmitis]|uniref:Zinc-binding alcohol dehydrogenase domain-containing protein cipB n=1 Tax=Apiospora phragmitis TaxID=2905665 RepID=A0ABR1TNR2_9PEZI
MPQTPENQAAWLKAPKATPLEVGPAPYPRPGPGQLVVQTAAVGINPIDCLKQSLGDAILPHIRYPTVFGEDVAGTVAAVGEGVTRFRVGDRVLAVAGLIPSNNPAEGAFQRFTVVREWLTAPLPEGVSVEQGCVLPLALIVAGLGLFGKGYLGLDPPTVPAHPTPADTGSRGVVIIAGGASAVGSTGVQLAAAAGYEVVSTSSPKNFGFVKGLGAAHVVDYRSPTVEDELLAAVRGRWLVGALSLGDGTADYLATVLKRHDEGPGGPTKKFIARAEGKHSVEEGGEVEVKFILISPEVIGPVTPLRQIFEDYLPRALAEGQFVPRPKPEVVGKGTR